MQVYTSVTYVFINTYFALWVPGRLSIACISTINSGLLVRMHHMRSFPSAWPRHCLCVHKVGLHPGREMPSKSLVEVSKTMEEEIDTAADLKASKVSRMCLGLPFKSK